MANEVDKEFSKRFNEILGRKAKARRDLSQTDIQVLQFTDFIERRVVAVEGAENG